MKNTSVLIRLARPAVAVVALAALSACGTFHDVDNKWCPPEQPVAAPAPAPAPVPVHETINLQADALFHFDRGNLAGMLPKGRQELDELAHKLNNDYKQVENIRITLTGYTDRLGSVAYNLKLSELRANTVKTYLQQHGVTAPMQAIGKGKADPITTNCVGNRATPALEACLQPDRRVVVEITGVKR